MAITIEVFKKGIQTDAGGYTRNWSEEDLNKIVTSYDPKFHEAPIVIGHPKDNAPAFGWVKSLKYSDGKLFAEADLIPEFEELIKKGLYKKRSIALNKDGGLRHIGFLGAMPPAVKGLADIRFNQAEENVYIEFETSDNSWLEEENKALKIKIKQLEKNEAKTKHEAIVERLIASAKLAPTQRPAILEFMEAIDSNHEFEFSEASGEKKRPLDFFTSILEALPERVSFGEFATEDRAINVDGLTPLDVDVCKKMGVSVESYKKALESNK